MNIIRLDSKERNHYTGLLDWMKTHVGEAYVDWEYVMEDVHNSGYGVVVGIKILDPQKELLAIMRWS